MAPRRSWYSPILMMSALGTTLEMMTPEKTPLGKVTYYECQS